MRSENDWRLTNQADYLQGVVLTWRHYQPPRPDWDHDHCEFCGSTFSSTGLEGSLSEGFVDTANYHWICKPCYEDFADMFAWRVTGGAA